jgi:hypothetical protein
MNDMNRLFTHQNLQKMTNLTFAAGLFLTVSAFNAGPAENNEVEQTAPQQKVQRVKVTKIENGKTINIDTTFNFANEKVIQLKVDSMLKKLDVVEGKSGEPTVIIMRKGDKGKTVRVVSGKPSDQDAATVIYSKDCDTSKVKCKNVVCISTDGGKVFSFDGDGGMMPPPPPMPPGHMKAFKVFGGDPFAFDADNSDIISYDKKDIGKGLEKITIVRKKHTSAGQQKEIQMKVEVTDEEKK